MPSLMVRAYGCLFFMCFFLCCNNPLFAQRWQWAQHATYSPFVVNSVGGPVTTDAAGNVYTSACLGAYLSDTVQLGGVTTHFGPFSTVNSPVGPYYVGQAIVVKYDAAGNPQWILPTQGCDAGIGSLKTDAAGNLYVLGVYDNSPASFGGYPLTLPVLPATTQSDGVYFLAKVSPTGVVLWARNIFATAAEQEFANSGYALFFEAFNPYGGVVPDASGNCYIVGNFIDSAVTVDGITLLNADPTQQNNDIFVAKFDSAGHTLWARRYGGPKNEWPSAPVPAPGGLYIGGLHTDSVLSFGSISVTGNPLGGGHFAGSFFARLDSNGNAVWVAAPDSVANDILLAG